MAVGAYAVSGPDSKGDTRGLIRTDMSVADVSNKESWQALALA